ncbi:MAG: phenylacetate--CoA ligase family protein [Candidatus Odinarchaeia archaeon]
MDKFIYILKYLIGKLPDHVRYGKNYLKYYDFLKNSQYNTKTYHTDYQFKKLRNILIYSYKYVPYYCDMFRDIGFNPSEFKNLDDIRVIPFLDKSIVKENFDKLTSRYYSKSLFTEVRTGGSIGDPMICLKEKGKYIEIERAFTAIAFEWAGFRKKKVTAVLRGDTREGRGTRFFNRISSFDPLRNKVILSSYHITDSLTSQYLEAFRHYKPAQIHAYPSSLNLLVNLFRKNDIAITGIDSIVTSSETLYSFQRKNIEEYFETNIYDLYGNTEQTVFAMQCGHSESYHIFPEYSYVEIMSDNTDITSDNSGEIVSTSFHNYAMPLIRYRTGDIVTLDENDCICGRAYPRLKNIYGRKQDYFVTSNNSLVPITGGTDGVALSSVDGIIMSQFFQDKPGHVILKVNKTGGLTKNDKLLISESLRKRYGDSLSFYIIDSTEFKSTERGKHLMIEQNLSLDI